MEGHLYFVLCRHYLFLSVRKDFPNKPSTLLTGQPSGMFEMPALILDPRERVRF
jgi:hypothetical protein